MKSEDLRKAIELTKRVMAELDELKAENERTLREVRPRIARAEAELRRAGYLR
jgi:hypothetical protein